MSRGRCSGCGVEDASCKRVRVHVQTCAEYLALFKSDPSKCLDPEEEFRRFKAERDEFQIEAEREEKRASDHARFRAAQARRVEHNDARWASVRTRFTSSAGREVQVGAPVGVAGPVVEDTPTGAAVAAIFEGYV